MSAAGIARWRYQQDRDEQLYALAWFEDFRARWGHALRAERVKFRALMEAL